MMSRVRSARFARGGNRAGITVTRGVSMISNRCIEPVIAMSQF